MPCSASRLRSRRVRALCTHPCRYCRTAPAVKPIDLGRIAAFFKRSSEDLRGSACSLQNVASLRLRDQTIRIVLQQVPSTYISFGGGAHLRDIFFVSPIALFKRRPRVPGSEPLGFRLGERNKCARIRPDMVLIRIRWRWYSSPCTFLKEPDARCWPHPPLHFHQHPLAEPRWGEPGGWAGGCTVMMPDRSL